MHSAAAAANERASPMKQEGGGHAGEETDRRNWSSLMARAQRGDRAAYSVLLEEVAPFLRLLASRRLQNAEDVEDAVQDTLLTIHAIRHVYDPRRPFGPWLAAIARRRIADRLRRRLDRKSVV